MATTTTAEPSLKELKKQLAELEAELVTLQKRDWKKYAQDLIDKLFGRFKRGARWLSKAKACVETTHYMACPHGRRRNLAGGMTGISQVIGAMARRAMNSPIQGFASDIAVSASRLLALQYYNYLAKFYPEDLEGLFLPGETEKIVHDALYCEVPFRHVIAFTHILQYTATYGVTALYRKRYGVEFTVEPEIEMEFSASEDAAVKWDWTDSGMLTCLTKAVDNYIALYGTEDGDRHAIMKEILSVYRVPGASEYLTRRYPILNVEGSSLEAVRSVYREQIRAASKE